jgi:hypothetical protein
MGGMRRWGSAQQWVFLVGLVVLLAAVPRAHAAGKPAQIVGGNIVTSPEEAPWSVFVSAVNGEGATLCSGTIIGADRVVTAAHCVFDRGQLRPPGALSVVGGIVDGRLGADWSRLQSRQVKGVAAHPGYDPALRGYDIAVLVLSTPFDISGAAVRPIAVASAPASPARVYGWGQTSETTRDDRLHSLTQGLVRAYRCVNGVPAMLCGQTLSGATCFGDSGSGLVIPGAPPRLLGVESLIVGDDQADCDVGERTGYIDVTAPAIAAWLAGTNNSLRGPRASTRGVLVPGDPVTCLTPTWTGEPQLTFDFIAVETGQVLQSGPATYRPGPADLGHPITCAVVARNAGGSAETLAAAPVTMYDPGLGLQVAPTGVLAFSRANDAAPLSRLVVYDRDGALVRSIGVDLSKPVTVPKLPAGRYQVCVQSDPTPTFVAGSACQPWIVAGKAANLVDIRSVKRWHGRWRVALRISPALIGKRVTLRWRIAKCRTCGARHVTVRRKLAATVRVNSPRVPRPRVVRLTVIAPKLTYDGVPYAAGHRALKIHG